MTINQKQNVKDIAKLVISAAFLAAICMTAYFLS